VYRQLQRLCLEVEGRHDEWSPETTVEITDLRAGELLTTLTHLRSLVHRRLQLNTTPPPPPVSQFTLSLVFSSAAPSQMCHLTNVSVMCSFLSSQFSVYDSHTHTLSLLTY